MVLKKEYFKKSAKELAPDLVGKILCRRQGDEILRARITETECYFGEEDTACHAHKGKTPRTVTLYAEGGISYVYLCYGMHSLLNFVTGEGEHPEAVLIRGVEGASGPGRVTKMLGITRADNALPLDEENGIWVEDDGAAPPKIQRLPRVGIDYASKRDRERKWRFLAKVIT
ncbi:MAG: DNA-3-methyladenine glycosylase [Clostridia bacterium]|nr:DNA-3-methyladenine glycosylase [Clostridia bacterium]